MKTIPYLLVGGVLALASACSSSNTTTGSGSTSGSSTGTSSSMDAGTTSGSTATSTMSTPMGTGSISNAGSGTAGSSGSAGTSDMTGTSGAAGAADMTAFMGTFATMQDPVFLMTAASSNLLEIQMGQMATQKSTNAEVKRFGQMMVDHHTKATQELKTVASPLGVTLPQTMMPVHQAMADRLMAKSGKAFDEDYMDAMEVAHKMDIAMFEVKSKGAETPAVKSFATKTLPMLRSHHTMANEIEKKVD
ncbi:DUF4142 domain-containing protein [Hymenobacter cellulosivorans]|uniref:DUF4142 domain-containing protein n=1 Tax=Hymenobacter cellulosivorans TaxID=2932249 RepID=A0ABY4FEK0_9BACT|nr:DUF4142 domain-containing protein [Hymenobacter cellulosivorans]UOQ55103.1 DUF4142 domain-containing protein [Hymenobacter cellulosivorans]